VVRVVRGHLVEWGECLHTVALDDCPLTVACWKDIIAVGCHYGRIIILDGITGSQKAVFSGHTGYVMSVTFSSDGTSLVSGGGDSTVKLWDVQTGGVVKTFYGHTGCVISVSISGDCTIIASGSEDGTVRLWDIQAEECLHIIKQQERVYYVGFSPMDSQCLISASGGEVCQWDISGCKINPVHNGFHVTFHLNQIELVLCQGVVVTVQHFDVRQLHGCCCLIPGGRLIAVAAGSTINVWNIASSDPILIKTYVGHSGDISSLIFCSPSSLISSCYQESVKFWQIGDLLVDPVITDPKSTPGASASIMSITLQATDGITISSDSKGVVRVWDISTGHHKKSFQTPAKGPKYSDARLINNRLIFVWYLRSKIYFQDVESGQLQVMNLDVGGIENIENIVDVEGGQHFHFDIYDVKISGDGSTVFCLRQEYIQAWSTLTGELVSKVEIVFPPVAVRLTVDGSRVWVHSKMRTPLGWDFGIPGSFPVQLPNPLSLPPNGTKQWDIWRFRITDTVTGKVVFHLAGRFGNPIHSQWDGQYLVAGYKSGEVLILDFDHVIL